MISQFRKLNKSEFFVIGVDCSQGGIDANYAQFLSKTQIDVPLKLKMQGVAADMTPILHQTLEWIFDQTGIQPVVAIERNMGGASEMERLRKLNRLNKYRLYTMRTLGTDRGEQTTPTLGFSTTAISRPQMVGDLKVAIDSTQLKIYDQDTVDQLSTFIVNKAGKPVAASNTHDDAVMSLAIAWQLYQTEHPPVIDDDDDYRYSNATSMYN